MKSFNLRRLVTGAIVLFAASSIYAQSMGPDVIIPATTMHHKGEDPHKAHTNYLIYTGWKHKGSPILALSGPAWQTSSDGYTPSQVQAAYDVPATGGSEAIAVIDAFDLPTNLNDFNTFSRQYGLPSETSSVVTSPSNAVFQVVYPGGSKPASNPGWGAEIALDVEWAHAMAPKAKIYLIECASDNFSDLLAGVQYVNQNLPNVREVNMSFGGTEFSGQTSYDSFFGQPNVVYLAASGDLGTGNETPNYPATSPYVIAVGGTHLQLSGNSFDSETAWNDSDGGPSTYEPTPTYQNSIALVKNTGFRGTPDVAADGDPNTGCWIYDSTSYDGSVGWQVYGGTSLSCPIVAGILNSRGYFGASSTAQLTQLYSQAGTSVLRDITSGSASDGYSAGTGYDFVTGLGALLDTFKTRTFTPTGGSIVHGSLYLGVSLDMDLKDGHDWVIRSLPVSSVETAEVQSSITAKLPSGVTALGANLSLTGLSFGTTNTVSILNAVTGNWDTIGTISWDAVNGTQSLTIPNYSAYVSSSNVVQFRITSTSTSAALFKLGIDQVVLQVVSAN